MPAVGKSPVRIFRRHFATGCSEMEIRVKNHTDVWIFHTVQQGSA